jgi:cullin-associated NEDD8-dissociated protein 1
MTTSIENKSLPTPANAEVKAAKPKNKKERLFREVAGDLKMDFLEINSPSEVKILEIPVPPAADLEESHECFEPVLSPSSVIDDTHVKSLPNLLVGKHEASANKTVGPTPSTKSGWTKSFTPSTTLPSCSQPQINEMKEMASSAQKAESGTQPRKLKRWMMCAAVMVLVVIPGALAAVMAGNGSDKVSGAVAPQETSNAVAVNGSNRSFTEAPGVLPGTQNGDGSTTTKTTSTTSTSITTVVQTEKIKAKVELELDFGDLPEGTTAEKLVSDTRFVDNVQGSIAKGLGVDPSRVFINKISLPARRLRLANRRLSSVRVEVDYEVIAEDEKDIVQLQEKMGDEASQESKAAFVDAFKSEFQAKEAQSGRKVAVLTMEVKEVEVVAKPSTTGTPEEFTTPSPASDSLSKIGNVTSGSDEGTSTTASTSSAPEPALLSTSGHAPALQSPSPSPPASSPSPPAPRPRPSPSAPPSPSPPSPSPTARLVPAPASPGPSPATVSTTAAPATTTLAQTSPAPAPPRTKEGDAQFLIQATFGPTRSSLAELQATDYSTWIQTQMDLPAESHRAYYRSRANPRFEIAEPIGSPYPKCSVGSRWQNFAFTFEDKKKPISVQSNEVKVDGVHRMDVDPSYLGNVIPAPSACTNDAPEVWISKGKSCTSGDTLLCKSRNANWGDNKYCRQSCYDQGYGYEGDDCSNGWVNLGSFDGYICSLSQEALGAHMTLSTDSTCATGHIALSNPGIWFSDSSKYSITTLQFDTVRPGVLVLKEASDTCTLGSAIKVEGKLYRSSSRLELLENTLQSPNVRSANTCPTVPETFLNEKSCVLQSTCTPLHLQSATLHLNKTSFQQFHDVERKYLFSIAGLRTTESPCGTLSRWQLLDCDAMSCSATATVSASDSSSVAQELQQETGWLRDVHITCDSIDADAVVQVGAEFWKHVHIHEHNVYDFTSWVDAHPGGKNHIQKWTSQNFQIIFPSGHLMERWMAGSTQNSLEYLGRLGDEIDFHSLPTSLQSQALADAFSSSGVSGYFKSCGSPGETANDPKLGNQVSFWTVYDGGFNKITDLVYDKPYEEKPGTSSKAQVWTMLAINAQDQLRQRTAWALSQIFAVGSEGYGNSHMTERWIVYYDIFVRNAFGNFRDVLREVTYNPLMGGYLTFMTNKAYDEGNNFPDENYAREIMQLFTIGLFKLNSDGSRVKDANGADVPTYDNTNIMDFARVFTGFDQQLPRANIEKGKGSQNKVDPMQMKASWHDRYPKPDLDGGFLGDGYPLCSDLPPRAFLAKGAQYKFLGYRRSEAELYTPPTGSQLFAALCNGPANSCNFAIEVELSSNLVCHEKECTMDTLQYIKIGSGYWEYVPPTCVHFFFFPGKLIRGAADSGGNRWGAFSQCKDPKTVSAGTSCCGGCTNAAKGSMSTTCESAEESWLSQKCNTDSSWTSSGWCRYTCWQKGLGYPGDDCSAGLYQEKRMCGFPRERVRFATAEANCAAQGLQICSDKTAVGDCGFEHGQVWTQEDCVDDIKVDAEGRISSQATADTKQNFFSVPWQSGFPTVDSCPSGCSASDGGCICTPTIELQKVFDVVPSRVEALDKLKIGSFKPTAPCSTCDGEVRVYKTGDAIDESTVFEVDGQFFKNAQSIVKVGTYSFRNAPVFLTPGWITQRAALAEVESLLDHLFRHPNTPVFIAYRLIQRLVTSNPSPTYISDVGQAFRTGQYGGKTYSGKYGDLGATVAAILLHPEARGMQASATMGKLREPIIKIIHFFRAMEYSDSGHRQVILQKLEDVIGQSMTESPSVFNFYNPDYQPARFSTGVVGPEFQIFTAPFAVGFLNGMTSLIDHGLVQCEKGFGPQGESSSCNSDSVPSNAGGLTLGKLGTVQETIDLLDLLLTGGRLNNTKEIVQTAFETAPEADQMKAAQKAVLLSPEFHTIGNPQFSGTRSAKPAPVVSQPKNYRATVMLFLDGGADTFNLLVPMECSLYDEYSAMRKDMALQPSYLHEISTTGQQCSKFGIHYALPYLKTLYDNGQAAFVSNVGSLVEPTTRAQWKNGDVSSCVGLFSHSDQKSAAATLQCQTPGAAPKGAGGRLADALSAGSQKYTTTSFSVAGTSTWSQGFDTRIEIIDKKEGAVRFGQYSALETMLGNITSKKYGNIFCEEYAKQIDESIASSESLGKYLDNVTLTTNYKAETKLEKQLHQVARLIKTREERKAERDLFFVHIGGFDSHSYASEVLEEKFKDINDSLEGFVAELVGQGVFDDTVLFTESDFGRSLTSNGAGTDHGWAGNHFVIGGNVQGGKVFNDFPDSLLAGNEYDAGRGRMIPKYPWESMMVPIAEWMGLESSQHASVFPNLGNFNSSHVISRNSLFSS